MSPVGFAFHWNSASAHVFVFTRIAANFSPRLARMSWARLLRAVSVASEPRRLGKDEELASVPRKRARY